MSNQPPTVATIVPGAPSTGAGAAPIMQLNVNSATQTLLRLDFTPGLLVFMCSWP